MYQIVKSSNNAAMEAENHLKNGAGTKSHTSSRKLLWLGLFVLMIASSGCSYRLIDFTVISSKNHSLAFDKSKGVRAEGSSIRFLGLGATIKGAMDSALEKAGPEYDLLIDGVVYQSDYFFTAGYRVTGTAVRSGELKAMLGAEGFENWCKANHVFDPATAVVWKQ